MPSTKTFMAASALPELCSVNQKKKGKISNHI